MTVAMLRERGVDVDDAEPNRWIVSPGPIAPATSPSSPTCPTPRRSWRRRRSPAARSPFRTGRSTTDQPGDQLRGDPRPSSAPRSACDDGRAYRCTAPTTCTGSTWTCSDASELTPVVAAVAALADHTSHIRGVGHIRGHETDRLAALEAELEPARRPRPPDRGRADHPPAAARRRLWRTYADHRMAQAGALLGLVVPDVELDDICCTGKTMPEFVELWTAMIDSGRTRRQPSEAARLRDLPGSADRRARGVRPARPPQPSPDQGSTRLLRRRDRHGRHGRPRPVPHA